MRHPVPLLLILAALIPGGPAARACSIPVFRYALERWPASAYDVIIFRKGQAPVGDAAAADRLSKLAANAEFRAVDVDAPMDPADAELWKQQPANAKLPRAVIRYPDTTVKAPSAWQGPFDLDALIAAIDSPARREIANRLIAGQSCVWVLLSGSIDKAADDALAETLEKELKRQERQLKLPEIAADGPQLRSPVPLRLTFSALRVRRDDPREAAFVELLKHVEPEYANSNEALIIPVIGRGRAITAIPASRLTDGRIDAFAEFVTGQCSCEVKEQNPGIDLLIAANWDAIFGDDAPPAAEQRAPRESKAGASVPIPVAPPELLATAPAPASAIAAGSPPPAIPSPTDPHGWTVLAIAAAAAVAVVSGAVALRGRKK